MRGGGGEAGSDDDGIEVANCDGEEGIDYFKTDCLIG
jgi:hypothetical protein